MPKFPCLIVSAMVASSAFFACGTVSAESDAPLVLAVSTYPDPTYHDTAIETTIAALKTAVRPRILKVISADAPELSELIHSRRADLAIINAGHYRQMTTSGGLRDIATLLPPGFTDQNHCDGGAIVVRSDSPYRNIPDLKGKRLSANTTRGFNGYVVEMGEIARQGFDPDTFFTSVHLMGEGQKMSAAALEVLNGQADAAFLRMCLLEHLENAGVVPKGQLRVLEPYNDAPPLVCRRSTALYPSWVLATTPTATPELSRLVTKTILNLPQTPNGFSWGLATDFRQVDALYKTLRLGSYEYLRDWSFQRLWQSYRHWILGVLLLLCAAVLHYAHCVWLVNRKTRELRAALIEQQRLEKEKLQAMDRIGSLQKAASVSQLSSLFAHELGQPLNALVCFSEGLATSLSQRPEPKTINSDDLSVLSRISRQAQRAKAVLDRVRSYAKGKSDRQQKVDLSGVLQKVVGDLRLQSQTAAPIAVQCPVGCFITGCALEIELILLNLIKNALDAVADAPQAAVAISVRQQDDQTTLITVKDNGPILTDEQLNALTYPLYTTKKNGLGLGLSIVKSLCEAHRARLTFARNTPSGLIVSLLFPAAL